MPELNTRFQKVFQLQIHNILSGLAATATLLSARPLRGPGAAAAMCDFVPIVTYRQLAFRELEPFTGFRPTVLLPLHATRIAG